MLRRLLWIASVAAVAFASLPAWAEPPEPKPAAAPMRQGRGDWSDRWSQSAIPGAGRAADLRGRAMAADGTRRIAAAPLVGREPGATPRAAEGIAVRRDSYAAPVARQPRAADALRVGAGVSVSSGRGYSRGSTSVGFTYSDYDRRPARYSGPVSVPYEHRYEPVRYYESYYRRPYYSPVYYAPRPVYYCPPPVYCAPAYPVYCPPPVYYCPPRSGFSISFFGRF